MDANDFLAVVSWRAKQQGEGGHMRVKEQEEVSPLKKKKREGKGHFAFTGHLPPAPVEILQPGPPCPLSLVILPCG